MFASAVECKSSGVVQDCEGGAPVTIGSTEFYDDIRAHDGDFSDWSFSFMPRACARDISKKKEIRLF